MSVKELVQEALRSEWWNDLKGEIARTVVKRVRVDQDATVAPEQKKVFKPHGSVLAQTFIDEMNRDITIRRFVPYLISRDWPEILEDILPTLEPAPADEIKKALKAKKLPDVEIDKFIALEQKRSEDDKVIFKHPEAGVWFVEFSRFLTASWNASVLGGA